MKNLIRNWNYGKHAGFITTLYIIGGILLNCLLGTHKAVEKISKEDLKYPAKCANKLTKKLTKKQKQFNTVLGACYIFDMTVTFGVIKLIQRRLAP